ncbi:MAG TPA: hypothetical protein ENH11_09255 [Candidatus Acetothermia bacterium]|nr:hypothetical protein [Candidatus Acetothermia bacterium]
MSQSLEYQVENWKLETELGGKLQLHVLGESYAGWFESESVWVTALTIEYAYDADFFRLGVRPTIKEYVVTDAVEQELYQDVWRVFLNGARPQSITEKAVILRKTPLAGYYKKGSISLLGEGVWSLPDSCYKVIIADGVFSRSQGPYKLRDQIFRTLTIGGTLVVIEKIFGPVEDRLMRFTPEGLKKFLSVFRQVGVRTVGNWKMAGVAIATGGSWPPMPEQERYNLFRTRDRGWPMYVWTIAKK